MYDLSDLKELTAAQYDNCKARAADRVQKRIGDKPTRKAFKREYAPQWNMLDVLAGVIFLAALAVSSLHILAYSGQEAATSYTAATTAQIAGLSVDSHTYGVVHQIGFILLAEAAVLLFFVLFRTRSGLERWLSLALALMASIFVFVANLSSGLNVFLALLAPAFTIGIGFRLEALTAESLRRNQDIDARYLEALSIWERAQEDVSTHPDYRAFLAQEIWENLVRLKANQDYSEAPRSIKLAAVQREMARDSWAYDVATQPGAYRHSSGPVNGHSEVARPDPLPVTTNGRH